MTRILNQAINHWMLPCALHALRRHPRETGEQVHVLLCIADHYEPKIGHASPQTAQGRVELWAREYPRQFGTFRDSDGQPPRHTFFYPIEEYEFALLDRLTQLCQSGFGEVEVHLHHDGDTAENLRASLLEFKEALAQNHGLLSRDRISGELMYGFIHGNWALDNSAPDGRWCGINNELDILRQTGCYADFTLPSAPSPTQTLKLNSIYYAHDDPVQPKSHDRGIDVGTCSAPPDALMLIQGPLLMDWRRRKWGLVPRLENACLQASQPPTMERLDLWLRARVQVPKRPDWFFVKLHAHGAQEYNHDVMLGEPMVRFHQHVAERAERDPEFHFHYVTAREMFNLACAAAEGWAGTVTDARDYRLVWNNKGLQSSQVCLRDQCKDPHSAYPS